MSLRRRSPFSRAVWLTVGMLVLLAGTIVLYAPLEYPADSAQATPLQALVHQVTFWRLALVVLVLGLLAMLAWAHQVHRAVHASSAATLRELETLKNALHLHSIASIADPAGTVTDAIGTDITAARDAQKSLAAESPHLDNAAFLARASRIAGIGLWQLDLAHNTVHWSDQTCHIHDVAPGHKPTREEAIAFFAPEVQAEIRNAIEAAVQTGKPWDLELPLITAMGRQIWVRSAGEAEYQDGKRTQLVGIFQDITRHRQLEAEVLQKNILMQTILSNIPVGLSVMDGNLNLIVENPQFRTLLELPDTLFTGSTTTFESIIRFNAVRGEYGDGDREAIIQGIVGRARLGQPHHFQRRRGNGRSLEVRGAPMPDGGFVTTYSDITDLTRATEAAEQASRSKSDFVANMSHEIRSPMNAILGMLKLLYTTELSPRQQDYTSKAEGAAKSLLGLLNDVLDFSKMEVGKMALDPQPFRLDRLMRDLSVILAANVGAKPVEVLFDMDPSTPKVLVGDAMRLLQVLINLGGNAIKFTQQGEVVVHIKVQARTAARTTLRIAVRDSGIGIAPENQAHIFDSFAQAEASTTRRFGGTGLGLSICRRLVALMGGNLALHSALKEGSTFDFTITLPNADHVPGDPDVSPVRPALPMHVLVVDDNPVARDVLADMAQSWGWSVDVAGSGAQALEYMQTRAAAALPPYETLLVDWHMPQMDGWETIARMHQMDPRAQATLTIMVTAHGREMLSQRTAQEQARLNAFLVKPITASMLYDTVVDARAGMSNLRARPRAKTGQTGRLEGMRLLLVEDNPINQQVAQELLRAEGAVVQIADNGQLGVAAVAQAVPPFHAVLMDIQMPVMDGYAATRAIRQELGFTHLPVIAMTANAMASDREACLHAGMNDHVGKPFDVSHLVEVLLHQTRRSRPGVSQPMPAADAVDTDDALERLGGDTALYASILASYLDDITHMPDQLDAFLQCGDTVGAGRLLHTLKGLSATVGATSMAAVAKAAESMLKVAGATPPHDALRAHFRHAVENTQRTLAALLQGMAQPGLPQATAPVPNTHPPGKLPSALRADLLELLALLRHSDMHALAVHTRMQQTHASGAPNTLMGLGKAMAALDFAQASLQCEQLLAADAD